MMIRTSLILAAAFTLGACQNDLPSQHEDVREAAQDVVQARQEGTREVVETQVDATKEVAETHREATEDVAEARQELQQEIREMRELLNEMRQDPDLTPEEQARLALYEQRYEALNTRAMGAGENEAEWTRVRGEANEFGQELQGFGREIRD